MIDPATNLETAIVDIGSTSIRMYAGGQFHLRITRLGEGLAGNGSISTEALVRTETAFAELAAIAADAGCVQIISVATAAARLASNTDQMFSIAEHHFGGPPRLLTGTLEGELAFAGAIEVCGVEGPVVVLDIGGASTEFSVGSAGSGLQAVYSADIGAGSVTDQYLFADPPEPAELSAALSIIELHMVDVQREIPGFAGYVSGTVIGLGGTVTTVAAIEIGLDPFDANTIEGFTLTSEAAEDVFRTIATESMEDRAFNPGLSKDRAPMIVGGSCVLVEMMRHFGVEKMKVSNAGLIEGVAKTVAAGEWHG
jgi:exopolyphosphatase/guanosine-5'-triphosphate,3'-diphosphate pyrophosphatase